MTTADTIYKLYKCDRCYGDKVRMQTIQPEWVMESRNMQDLVQHIKSSTETNKTYCIEKYIDGDKRWRHLTVCTNPRNEFCRAQDFGGSFASGDITTVWEKYIWSATTNKWRVSNYRYDDEVVERNAWIAHLQQQS